LKHCKIHPIVLMTSTNPQDDPLVEIAQKNKIAHFRGSEEDVLLRMRDCARKFGTDLIISVTADDPLKEPIFIKKMVEKYLEEGFDFCEVDGLPNGCESYAVDAKALEEVCQMKDSSDTEIWGDYFRKSDKFKCALIKVEEPAILRPQYRVSVDTPEDFRLVSEIFAVLSKKKDYFDVYDVCRLLDENPDLVKMNSHIEQRPAPEIKIRENYD
jgi:spore coat polysaccharide biosynthesis protein SpsF